MITPIKPTLTADDAVFDQALQVVDRSGVDSMLDVSFRDDAAPGGRPQSGVEFTMRAVLVATLLTIMLQRPPTLRGILALIADLTDKQLALVGMPDQDMAGIRDDSKRTYAKFAALLDRRLRPIDPGDDLKARRTTNRDHRHHIESRTIDEHQASRRAEERLREVVNRLVAASVHDPLPDGFDGDLVADESIFDLAGNSYDLGAKPDRKRAASYCGRYYVRDRTSTVSGGSAHTVKKAAFGIGLTAITRVGPARALHSVPPVIVGIDIHEPTSGNAHAVAHAIDHARANGLLPQRSRRSAWPTLVVDMGYNPKADFAELMLERQYAWVGRYPKNWNTVIPSASVASEGPLPGPLQISGAFYCPAAKSLAKSFKVRATSAMLEQSPPGFLKHDNTLAALLPLLMGTNSRPFKALPTSGKPRPGRHRADPVTKMKFVCPAAMGRVRCPLKPESLGAEASVPLLEPDHEASTYQCCSKSSVTVTLTPEQLKLAQWGAPPGSWEHTLHFEAARALTEQRFSLLKSRSVTGIEHLKLGPRREPMIKIILALAVAAANLQAQDAYDRRAPHVESIATRLRYLEEDLGHPPTRTPPRT